MFWRKKLFSLTLANRRENIVKNKIIYFRIKVMFTDPCSVKIPANRKKSIVKKQNHLC